MTIIQTPATYNFAGNIPDLIVDTTEQLSFMLSRGGTQIVAETYTPAQNDRIVINLRNLLELLVEVPGYAETVIPITQYTYTLGSTSGTFYCLPGGHGAAVSAESFLRGNFLTWQPQTRITLYHTPHRLRYAALAACVCKVKGYFADGSSSELSLLTMAAGNIYTMDVSFGTIRSKFDIQPTYYDVWVENTTGQAMTWVQRYMLADFEAGTNDYFIFANSLGGFDTIRFSGDRKEINKLESVNAIFDDQTLEYDIDRTRSWKKYTGYIADEQLRMWVLDFFNSPQRYHLTDSGVMQRIYVSEPKLENTATEAAGYEFTYAYSRQSRYINLERTETPQLLEITDPASEVFFLAPRLNQFEAADPTSSADYLIPIQAAAADKWLAISLASLLDYIKPTGIDVDALRDYLTDHKYATQTWVSQQNFLTTAVLDDYLLKSVWDEVFEVTTVNGVRVLNVKMDIAGLKGISAYGLGSTSGGSASSSLGELVNVGEWADEVPAADRVMVQQAGATHWSAKPLADLVGLDTAALAQYLTENSYLKAGDISSYLTWANLSGKPTVYPTSWANIADKPTVYPTTWTSVTGRPTKLSQFTDDVVSGNYLPKPTWDAVFEVVTVDGTPTLKVKYDILGLKGITAYADGTPSGGFSGALVDLVDVAVTNLASGDILKYNGTHFVNVPVSSIAGASSWDQITGKPDYFPTRWADVSGAPTSLPASDVYPWAKASTKPTYTAAEVGALALSGGIITGSLTVTNSFTSGIMKCQTGAYPQLQFEQTNTGVTSILFVHTNNALIYRPVNPGSDYTVYHSGNFNPDNYLPLTGGKIITGDFQFKDGVAIRNAGRYNIVGLLNITGNGVCVAVGNGVQETRIVTPDDTPVYRNDGKGSYRIWDSGNFNPSSKLDKSVWDEAFELKTVNGVRVISAKLDFLSVAGISAYATGPSSGGGGGGLDYDLLKQALTGAITPDGYPFTISASFLGAIDKTYLTGKLANTYADKVHTHLWADITDRPTSLPANGGNADTVDNLHASSFTRADQSPIVDLNTVNGQGIMACGLNEFATAERHYPIQQAGTLFYGTAAYNSACQIYGTFQYNRWFVRGGGTSQTAKTAWAEIWTTVNFNPDNYLPLSGGADHKTTGDIYLGINPNSTTNQTYSICAHDGNGLVMYDQSGGILGPSLGTTRFRSGPTNLIHQKGGSDFVIWDASNFNPDSKLGVSSVAVEAKKMSYQGLMTAISGTTTFPAGLYLYGVYNNGYPVTYGNLLRVGGSGLGEMLFGWAGDASVGGLYYRSKRDVAATAWSSWCKLWTSANFNPDNYLLKTANAVSASKWATARTLTLTGSAAGSVSIDGSANVSLSVTNNRLNSNSEMTYGWNGLNYFNLAGTAGAAAKINDTPTTAWWHILRFNHGNSAGYYTDLAVPFNDNTLHYKRVTSGTLQNGGWVKVWDAKNSNLSTVDWAAKNITASGTIVSMSTVESRGDNSTGILPQMLWHIPGVTYARIRMANNGTLHVLSGGSEAYQSLYAHGFVAAGNVTAAGTVTAPTFVGNLSGSASLVNGYDINSFTGYYKYTIDASSLDQNTYYPVTVNLGSFHTVRISVIVALNSGTRPGWSTHTSGFSVRFIEEVNGSGWGTSAVSRNILANEYGFANANPVGRVEQMTNSSTEVIWVRGGGKYFFYLSIPYITPALRTSTFTNASQSVSPRTDTMDLRMAANGNGIAVSKLYAHNSIEINGFTIDVYNGALRVNGNLVATGGVTSLATA